MKSNRNLLRQNWFSWILVDVCEESGSKQYSTRIAEITFANHRNCSPNSGDCCHQTPNFVGLSALESSLCCMIQIYWFQNQCSNRESRPKSLELLKIESFCNIVSASNWRFPNKKKNLKKFNLPKLEDRLRWRFIRFAKLAKTHWKNNRTQTSSDAW